ncbi:MAG TPA: right-handed parallel beta-helix repeat-containing protein [Allosphingosinicella sp.]|nr:right-handed parallel beta-helix repeat-containing protein [Allosphingosinicella sp.]
MITRRHLLLAGMSAPVCWAGACFGAVPPRVVSPEDFGARGDGRTDDTAALQLCLDLAPAGAIVRLRSGAVYRVDPNYRPTRPEFGGLRLKSGQTLELNGAELRALPSPLGRSSVVQAFKTSGWKIVGPGRITGERMEHRGTGGEWGMGISAWDSHDWQIVGVEVANCWGDGIYVGSYVLSGAAQYCENFLIDGVKVRNCRRNGISVVNGRNGEIRNVDIANVSGTNPQGAICLEPDLHTYPNRNIRISNGRIRDVQVGIYVTSANEGITITGMDIEAKNSGIIIANNSTDIRIENNPNIKSLIGGAEGGAIRTVADRPETVRGLQIRNNQLSGGGGFVVAIVGDGFQGVVVKGNRISATNAGTQGIAMIGAGQFTDNICVIGPRSGAPREFFIHLRKVSYGRNTYRNDSPHQMYSAFFGGRDIGGDRFESKSLVHYAEPL